jgi:hypothetical protein
VAFIASLNVAVIFRLMGRLIVPFTGLVEMTEGIVPVVKLHIKLLAKLIPVESVAPLVMVAVYSELGARRNPQVNVAVVPEKVTTPVNTHLEHHQRLSSFDFSAACP